MLALSMALLGALAQAAAPQQAQVTKSHVLIIAGVGGDSTYEKEFYEHGKKIAGAAKTKYGVPESMITMLTENPARDAQLIRGKSTKDEIERAFGKIAKEATPDEVVLVVLIGHGTSQGQETSMFAIPGTPDMSANDFATLLAPLAKQQVVFVNTTSASGDFAKKLAGKNRVIMTSTSSPMERNYAKFAKHFSAGFASDAADADKDGRLSMFEIFEYARRKVEQDYKSAQSLQSEHALLEDNGDGKGSESPELQGSDGRIAARLYLTGLVPEQPRITELLRDHEGLRLKYESLIAKRASMDAAAYGKELEALLTDLVIVSLKVRQATTGTGGTP